MHIDLAREKTVQGGRKHCGLVAGGSGARNVQQQQKRNNTVFLSFLLHVRRILVLLQVPIGFRSHTMQEKIVVLFFRFCFCMFSFSINFTFLFRFCPAPSLLIVPFAVFLLARLSVLVVDLLAFGRCLHYPGMSGTKFPVLAERILSLIFSRNPCAVFSFPAHYVFIVLLDT